MKKIFLLFSLIVFSKITVANDYYIYVCAESEDEVALIKFDGKKAVVEKTIPVGVWPLEIEGPHGITVSPDGEHWYLSMAHGMPYGHLYKYETGTDKFVERVELGMFPATMEISKATGLLYVVNFNLHGGHSNASTVSIVDPDEMVEVERVETGIMPHGSRILNNGLKHYSVAMMSGMLYEIDAMSMEVTRTLRTSPPAAPMKMSSKKGKHSSHSMHSMNNSKKMSNKDKKGMAAMGHMAAGHNMPHEKPTWVYPHPNDDLLYVVNLSLIHI